MGMTLSTLTDDVRQSLGLSNSEKGVVVLRIEEGSEAFDRGIRQGDLIVEVGQKPVNTAKEVAETLQAAEEAGRKTVLLLVRRDGSPRFMALPLGQ